MNWRSNAFFALHRLIGSQALEYYQEFLRFQSVSAAKLQTVTTERLNALLRHAVANVPYYREQPRARGSNLTDFPILTKAIVRERFTDLMTDPLRAEYKTGKPRRRYSWVEVKTGGSTGEPTRVIHDREFRDRGRASRLFSQQLCGFPLGTPYFMLWGSMREITAARDSWTKRVMNLLLNVRTLNAFQMTDAKMTDYLRLINESPAEHMMAYVDACDQLAQFVLDGSRRAKPLRSVMACAGTVTDAARERIEQAFSTRVRNKYGSRDCTDMACECAAGRLHIYSHHVRLEVVDADGQPAPPGNSGRILVTLLGNHSFPMIRYEIGDQGRLDSGGCDCGLPFPTLQAVEGRSLEFIRDTSGGFVTPIYLRHLIGVVHNPVGHLRRFQLTQSEPRRYELLLEVGAQNWPGFHDKTWPQIERDLRAVLGADAVIESQRVESIPESASGKFIYVRNLVNSATS